MIEIRVENRLGSEDAPLLASQGGSLRVMVFEHGKALPLSEINVGGWLFRIIRSPLPSLVLFGKETAIPSFALPQTMPYTGLLGIECVRGSWKGATIEGQRWWGWVAASAEVLHTHFSEDGGVRVVDKSIWLWKDLQKLKQLQLVKEGANFHTTEHNVQFLKNSLSDEPVVPEPSDPEDPPITGEEGEEVVRVDAVDGYLIYAKSRFDEFVDIALSNGDLKAGIPIGGSNGAASSYTTQLTVRVFALEYSGAVVVHSTEFDETPENGEHEEVDVTAVLLRLDAIRTLLDDQKEQLQLLSEGQASIFRILTVKRGPRVG